jgi:hypothetical protein
MCIALADEIHQVRNTLPDRPTIMYLSVTPHVHPTHTGRNEDDSRHPPRFSPNTNYHAEYDMSVPVETLLGRHIAAVQAVAEAAAASAQVQAEMAGQLRQAIANGDEGAALAARNAMWEAVYTLHKRLYAADQAWNEFSPRATEQFTPK